ncbi:unnamed protein product [Cylindrotheca closterium]|uniref:SAP domain-containing protein n=1 Tax=Cylindrotheca closterium TaxID=2856 RepID=A0AAD2FR98_9STRA|nr:unnamed protein product [Cylindrotheca closterium]
MDLAATTLLTICMIVLTVSSRTTLAFQPSRGNQKNANPFYRRESTKLEVNGFWDALPFAPKYKEKRREEDLVQATEYLEQVLEEAKASLDEANLALADADSVLSRQKDDGSVVLSKDDGGNDDWSCMTVPMLKQSLKDKGLKVSGKKVDLVRRLEAFESEMLDDTTSGDDTEESFLEADGSEEIETMESDTKQSIEDFTVVGGQPNLDLDYSSMTVPMLKQALKDRGLKESGEKVDLVGRLEAFESEMLADTTNADDTEESVLEVAEEADDSEDPVTMESDIKHSIEDFTVVEQEQPEMDYSSMTVTQLKEELRALELPVGGKKADLIARLESHNGAPSSPTTKQEDEPEPAAVVVAVANDDSAVHESPPDVDYSGHTVAKLKVELRKKGLKVGGKKEELIERLQSA